MFASQVDLAPNVGRRFSLHATACAPSYDAWQTTRPRTSRALAPSSPSFSNRSLPPSAKNSSRDMSTTCRRRSIVCSSQSTSRPETALPFRSLPSVVASADAHVRPGLRFSTGRCSRRARRRARSRPRRRRALRSHPRSGQGSRQRDRAERGARGAHQRARRPHDACRRRRRQDFAPRDRAGRGLQRFARDASSRRSRARRFPQEFQVPPRVVAHGAWFRHRRAARSRERGRQHALASTPSPLHRSTSRVDLARLRRLADAQHAQPDRHV